MADLCFNPWQRPEASKWVLFSVNIHSDNVIDLSVLIFGKTDDNARKPAGILSNKFIQLLNYINLSNKSTNSSIVLIFKIKEKKLQEVPKINQLNDKD